MAIKITRQLTDEQYIKLFSNPVSGIACDLGNPIWAQIDYLKDIRYSKSMILGALSFWSDQLFKFYLKITKITNPLAPHHDSGQATQMDLNTLNETIERVRGFPDTFLFSHRYIQAIDEKKYSQGMKIQKQLLQDKYYVLIQFQQGTVDPFDVERTFPDFQFTVFPNEHPYIRRTVIAEVGQTSKGHTFVIKK